MAFAARSRSFWGIAAITITIAMSGCSDEQVVQAQGAGLNPANFIRGKEVIAIAIGDDGAALSRKNPAIFSPDLNLTEPQMFSGDLRLDYDDGTVRYRGCAWRIFAGAMKMTSDGVAFYGENQEIEHDAGLTLITAAGCQHYETPEEAASAAEAAIEQIRASAPQIETFSRYDSVNFWRSTRSLNGVDCSGPIDALVPPSQELRCVHDNAAKVWTELDGPQKMVNFASLGTPGVRVKVSVMAVLPGNITFDSSASPPREVIPREQLRPNFYLSVSFESRDMDNRPTPGPNWYDQTSPNS